MGRFCGPRRRTAKVIGALLMAAGTVVLLLSLPKWLWVSLAGIALISAGYLIWRFS